MNNITVSIGNQITEIAGKKIELLVKEFAKTLPTDTNVKLVREKWVSDPIRIMVLDSEGYESQQTADSAMMFILNNM